MPLQHSSSPQAFKSNVRTLMHEVGASPHVQSPQQALAIAYATQRRAGHHADGGQVAGFALGGAPAPWQIRNEARSMMHTGPILSTVPGRTDRHNMSVPSGSYVMPAQAISHLGQSNTLAGARLVSQMFGLGPYGSPAGKVVHGAGAPRAPKPMSPLAAGGSTDSGGARGDDIGAPVDVVTAGGEVVIPPENLIQKFREMMPPDQHGSDKQNLRDMHNIMDSWMNQILDDHIRELKKLPPPAKN